MPIALSECIPRIAGSRVVVTGGAGFIGSHLVDFLVRQGAERVIVIDNLLRPRGDWLVTAKLCARIQFIFADIQDQSVLDSAFRGASVLYHLAAISRVMDACRSPEHAFRVNALGTVRVIESARRVGVRRVVFSSSREVYGDPVSLPVAEDAPLLPKNIYGGSKAAAEMYLRTVNPQNIEIVILRLANVYGIGDSGRVIPTFVANVLRGEPLLLYGGDKELDFIWVGDVVEILAKAGFSEKAVLGPTNVGSGMAIRLEALARRVCGVVKKNPACIQSVASRGPEVQRFRGDVTRARKAFGWCPPADPLSHLDEVLSCPAT